MFVLRRTLGKEWLLQLGKIMENKTKLNLLEERKTQLERTGFVKSIESKTIEELGAEITNLKSLIPVEVEEDLVNNEKV